MKTMVISNIEHETIYGVDVVHDLRSGEYRAFVGGKKITSLDRSTVAYTIHELQSHPSGV